MQYGYWAPYVPVGQKKAKACRFADKLAKKQKRDRQPIENVNRKIAQSFWGKAWCDHLETFSDYANRLPRGATYVRNGSVVDLVIKPGRVDAIVAGSEPYKVAIEINKLSKKIWDNIKRDCSSAIESLIDLLGGRLSDGVMQRLTEKNSGCFPSDGEIEMGCSCPDYSYCCKHIAAVMYAIGSRLDSEPELLFLLRGVNQQELISQAVSRENLDSELSAGPSDLDNGDLESIFGIEMDSLSAIEIDAVPKRSGSTNTRRKAATKKSATKKVAIRKTATRKSSRKKPTSKKAAAAVKKPAKKKIKKRKATKTSTSRKKTIAKKAIVNKSNAKTRVIAKKKVSVKKKAVAKSQGDTRATTKKSTSTKKASKVSVAIQPSKKTK